MAGDGVGPEVTAEAVKVIDALGMSFEFLDCPVGGEMYLKSGEALPQEALDVVNNVDAVLLGAVGHADTPYEIPRKVLVYLRVEKDAYANIRPLKTYPSVNGSDGMKQSMDSVIIRDNAEGFSLRHTGQLGATIGSDSRIITNFGARRIIKFAFEYALKNNRKKVTCVDLSGWLYSDKLFRRSFKEVAEKYPVLVKEAYHADVAAMMIARNPENFDVIVTPDIYGDILSGVAISHLGSVGMASSACIGDKFAYFEPVHGTAWDIVGKNVANPIASILSSKLMLEWLGFGPEAWLIEMAVNEVLEEGKIRTPDIGGSSTTTMVGDAIATKVSELKDEREEYGVLLMKIRDGVTPSEGPYDPQANENPPA